MQCKINNLKGYKNETAKWNNITLKGTEYKTGIN